MAQVRETFGADALILSSRRIKDGFEVTAGLELDDELAASPLPDLTFNAASQALLGTPPVLSEQPRPTAARADPSRAELLGWHGVPARIATRLGAGPLPFALSAALRFGALPLHPGAPPLLLVGPPGAGKTLTVARLATRLVLAGVTPIVATADAQRAGAIEQLAALTHVLGLRLRGGEDPEMLARAVAERPPGAPMLVDSGGLDPFAAADLAHAQRLAAAIGAEPVAVLPAGSDAAEAADMAAALAGIGARLMVATRVDVTRRLGSVVAAASILALAELGIGSGAADGLLPATPALLARRLGTGQRAPDPGSRSPSGRISPQQIGSHS